jgi:branched-chain amino acid transport system permease protein
VTHVVQVVVDGMSAGIVYVMLALGLSLVFSIMGLINFAYGSILVWAGYMLFAANQLGLPYAVSLALMVAGVTVLSVAMGRIAFLPFLGAPPSTLLLASFGMALASQAVAIMIFGEQPRPVPSPGFLIRSLEIGGVRISVLQITALALGGALLAGLHALMTRTRFGMEIRAAAEDSATARLVGVRSNHVLTVVFALTGIIAAVAAFIWFAQIGTVTPRADFNPTLKAFIAVVLGGLGTIRGAVIGGHARGHIERTGSATLPAAILSYQQSIAFAALILVLILRPQGIAGKVHEVSK